MKYAKNEYIHFITIITKDILNRYYFHDVEATSFLFILSDFVHVSLHLHLCKEWSYFRFQSEDCVGFKKTCFFFFHFRYSERNTNTNVLFVHLLWTSIRIGPIIVKRRATKKFGTWTKMVLSNALFPGTLRHCQTWPIRKKLASSTK